jgi:hypothetical protein
LLQHRFFQCHLQEQKHVTIVIVTELVIIHVKCSDISAKDWVQRAGKKRHTTSPDQRAAKSRDLPCRPLKRGCFTERLPCPLLFSKFNVRSAFGMAPRRDPNSSSSSCKFRICSPYHRHRQSVKSNKRVTPR